MTKIQWICMRTFLLLTLTLLHSLAFAESKISLDLTIDKLSFQKPAKGVGKAGTLIFKTAYVNNDGIVLNINNINNYFDSQIFVRPTFLGFITQFGDYGFTIDNSSLISSLDSAELNNSKLLLDDNQLNVSGESLDFINGDDVAKVRNFRLYCQNAVDPNVLIPRIHSIAPPDIFQHCINFLTLNGNSTPGNDLASLEYEGASKFQGDKMFLQSKIRSFDLRKNQISANLVATKTVSNNNYFISTNELNLMCAKDDDLTELDIQKMKKTCLNDLKIGPMKALINDKVAKSNFNLDIKEISVKNNLANFIINSGNLSDQKSTTQLSRILIVCKKESDSNLLDILDVLRDCTSYSRLSLSEVKSSKPDENKQSSLKNVVINSSGNLLSIQADTKFLGMTAHVVINGKIFLNETSRKLVITVTDTTLPLGIKSVKLLMYFLKKNIISKNVDVVNNVISVQF